MVVKTIDEAKQQHLRSKAATESATYGAMGLLAGAIFGMVKVYAASHPAAQTQLGVLDPAPRNFDNEAIGLFVKLADYRVRYYLASNSLISLSFSSKHGCRPGNEYLYQHAMKLLDELIGILNSIAYVGRFLNSSRQFTKLLCFRKFPDDVTGAHWLCAKTLVQCCKKDIEWMKENLQSPEELVAFSVLQNQIDMYINQIFGCICRATLSKVVIDTDKD